MCRLYYVFTVPKLLEEGLLRIKPASTMISWVSPKKPLFAQLSLVDPQLQKTLLCLASLNHYHRQNPQPTDPQQGENYS